MSERRPYVLIAEDLGPGSPRRLSPQPPPVFAPGPAVSAHVLCPEDHRAGPSSARCTHPHRARRPFVDSRNNVAGWCADRGIISLRNVAISSASNISPQHVTGNRWRLVGHV